MLNRIAVLVIITVLLFTFVALYTVEIPPVDPAARRMEDGSEPDGAAPNAGSLDATPLEVTLPPPDLDETNE